jgi:methylamine utilization protein MauE
MDHVDAKPRDYGILAGIILAILLGAIGLTYTLVSPSFIDGMRFFEGLFFLVFASFKLAKLRDFVDAYQGYDVIAKRSRTYASAYPFIELTLAAGFLANVALPAVLVATVLLMAVGLIGVIRELRRGSHIVCACLGTVIKVPLTQVTLAEDAVMGAMAAAMLLSL